MGHTSLAHRIIPCNQTTIINAHLDLSNSRVPTSPSSSLPSLDLDKGTQLSSLGTGKVTLMNQHRAKKHSDLHSTEAEDTKAEEPCWSV